MQLNANGEFISYYGTNKVNLSFWESLSKLLLEPGIKIGYGRDAAVYVYEYLCQRRRIYVRDDDDGNAAPGP